MAQSRIEEVRKILIEWQEEFEEKEAAAQRLEKECAAIKLEKEALEDVIDAQYNEYSFCGERIHVCYTHSSIAAQLFFERLSEKSKQFAGPNQFIEAIEKL